MARISIPGLVDLLSVNDAGTIADLAGNPHLDRRYQPRGPLVNRLLMGRVRRVLHVGGTPLPPVAERGPARPVPAQQALESRLDAQVAGGLGGPEIAALAAYVRGAGRKKDAGRLTQQLVGRLFSPTYAADDRSWAAGCVLSEAPGTPNIPLYLWWALTGRIRQARALLASKVAGDPSGLHATGVAIKNFVEAFERMRALYADPVGRQSSAAEALGRCLAAPRSVLRQATAAGVSAGGDFGADTLVVFNLRTANKNAPGYGAMFMTGAWAQCPAHRWVPAAMTQVWTQAKAEARP